ncbi:LOW QUALITY PROTEIN: uncharacterized protein LOC119741237 [Patiria miniata]|uniref:Uncharacterized protein n=1 Tax=Patiria miniata TaxID=46514 RepID=A0A914B9Q0_PATMI|nr:LOW QUALITY PROTEIN: uncharacterized protein LOC119741237 [Patiria miniata]
MMWLLLLGLALGLLGTALATGTGTDDHDDYPIRLVDGATDNEGRVEILFNGQWGTVNSEGWDSRDASVVCRQLGFYGHNSSVGSAYFGEGTGTILITYVGCLGNEHRLTDCAFEGWGVLASHALDVGILCQTDNDFPVRLVGGTSVRNGALEINFRGDWGSVSSDKWNALQDASVVCRELGFNGLHISYALNRLFVSSSLLQGVECSGEEMVLADCAIDGWLLAKTSYRVFVSCGIDDEAFLTVRLVDGLSSTQGRLEVNFDGHWESINSKNWDDAATSVVCRQLGHYGHNVSVQRDFFGRGEMRALIPYRFECRGDEATLAECQMSDDGVEYYGSSVGIVCQAVEEHPVRLIGGHSNVSGLVEVFFNGYWVAVCMNDNTGELYGRVVCSQLGYDGPSVSTNEQFFTGGHGHLVKYGMDAVQCAGNETKLVDCAFKGWGTRRCPSYSVGVVCQSGDAHPIRIVDGMSDTAGRVEVLFKGTWGAICSDGWDNADASVVCRQLGYFGPNVSVIVPLYYGSDLPLYLTNVGCKGHEDKLTNCPLRWWSVPCFTLAGVRCQAEDEYPIRLVDGPSSTEGRVEMFANGEWGTVCNDGWNANAASVVCRQLGYNNGSSISIANELVEQSAGVIQLSSVNCRGDEERLIDCSFPSLGAYYWTCTGHGAEIGVICQADEDFSIRLAGGGNPKSGRVELFFKGQWSTVCNMEWADSDADVVCRQLGFFGPSIAFTGKIPDGELRPLHISFEACRDDEARLAQCILEETIPGFYGCRRDTAAEVICQANETFPVRLVDGMSYASGRVEIFFNGQWGTVCSLDWDLADATVVCNQLGFDGAEASVYHSLFGEGTGPVVMNRVQCSGNESKLADCPFAGWGNTRNYCEDIVGVICNNSAFGQTCPPPESSYIDGVPTIEVIIPRGESTANVNWTLPTLVNVPESYEEYTTCKAIGDETSRRPCESGGSFGVTNILWTRFNNKTEVEVVMVVDLDGNNSVSHRCTFYISVRESLVRDGINPFARIPVEGQDVPATTAGYNSSKGPCPEDVTYNEAFGSVTWPATEAGVQVESVQKCPPMTLNAGSPVGKRNCLRCNDQEEPRWDEPQYQSCDEQVGLQNTGGQAPVYSNGSHVAKLLSQITSLEMWSNGQLSGQNINTIADILQNISSAGVGNPQVTDEVLDVADKTMRALKRHDASDNTEAGKLVSIAQSIETQVSWTLRQQGEVSVQKDSIKVKAANRNSSDVSGGLSFALVRHQNGLPPSAGPTPEDGAFSGSEVRVYESSGEIPDETIAAVSLPSNLLALVEAENGNSSLMYIATRFIAYGDDSLFPSTRKSLSGTGTRSVIPGAVVSVAVEDVELRNLTEPVVIQIQLPVIINIKEVTCVFWDLTLRNGVGDWSNAGCEFQGVTNGRHRCHCNHATNFAVFVELEDELKSYHRALNPITRIGCIASAGMYAFMLLMYFPFRKLRALKSGQIFAQFILSLLLLYTVLVSGVENAKVSTYGCVTVTALLHYLPLSTMMWTAIEARNMYTNALTRQTPTDGTYYMIIASTVAWGLPLIVTSISLIVATDQYGTADNCFLAPNLAMYLGILLPICLILVNNVVHFALVVRVLRKSKDEPPYYAQMTKRLVTAVGICTLTLAAWYVGYLSLQAASDAFSISFCAVNLVQVALACFKVHLIVKGDTLSSGKAHGAEAADAGSEENPPASPSNVQIALPTLSEAGPESDGKEDGDQTDLAFDASL